MSGKVIDVPRSYGLSIFVIFVLLYEVNGISPSDSTKRCGEVSCKQFQYCGPHDNHCRDCKEVCDLKSNNYEYPVCKEQCQDYLRYLQNADMESIRTVAVVAVVIACLSLVLVSYVIINQFIKRGFLQIFKKKKQMSAKFDVEATKNGLKLDMPNAQAQVPPRSASPSQCPVTPATTSTPLSRPRHPTEDATLVYAYDNPALAPSPVLDKDALQETPTRKESSF